jgi:hypothetical protein
MILEGAPNKAHLRRSLKLDSCLMAGVLPTVLLLSQASGRGASCSSAGGRAGVAVGCRAAELWLHHLYRLRLQSAPVLHKSLQPSESAVRHIMLNSRASCRTHLAQEPAEAQAVPLCWR